MTEPVVPEPVVPEQPSADLNLAFSPRQIVGGFALIAALIMLLVRRLRARKPTGR